MALIVPEMLSEGLRANIWSLGTFSLRWRKERYNPGDPSNPLSGFQPESCNVKFTAGRPFRDQVRFLSKTGFFRKDEHEDTPTSK